MIMNIFDRTVDIVKSIVTEHVSTGDIVIDATMGNGNDTLLLAKLVGNSGKVYSFDVQDMAIENTKKLLKENNIVNVDIIKDSHKNVKRYVTKNVQCVMFNLGYLPSTDKEITTRPDSTIKALNTCLELIKEDGIVTIISYYGHENGKKEKEHVESMLKLLNNKKFLVMKLENFNSNKTPPIIYMVKKIKH